MQAQIIADPKAPSQNQAIVLKAANGVPQVNVREPSAAGVSRNVYSQFDVAKGGAILNNSRSNVQTELGGWVEANPWLKAGAAKVILNEVNSNNPSALRGYIEVAGQKAEVVIANPSGISVDGGGFINVSRATLTTGSPFMTDGRLAGYDVQRGQIVLDGAGLDASKTEYTALISRSLVLNASLWAQRLNVVTGRQQGCGGRVANRDGGWPVNRLLRRSSRSTLRAWAACMPTRFSWSALKPVSAYATPARSARRRANWSSLPKGALRIPARWPHRRACR
ncbi:filamentous hemagglutinin N-terminal domain-containing protein [Massilia eburnea]|uniref:filamentous hemagglutinin N-terminal domain-containing protein n=1 Tax=Massilia eburnea TaxID=1776165 RepID=UPI003D6A8B22